MIEFKTLFLGLIFTLISFSVKVGAGLAYAWVRINGHVKFYMVAICSIAMYGSIFILSYHVSNKIDLVAQINHFQTLFSSGLILHFLLAVGLLVWAYALLIGSRTSEQKPSHGWLGLVVPCPVCLSAIFITACFLNSLFQEHAQLGSISAFCLFSFMSLISFAAIKKIYVGFGLAPELVLGTSMVFIALYFFISILITPHLNELGQVYRIAVYSSKEEIVPLNESYYVMACLMGAFTLGFVRKIKGGGSF